MLGNGTNGCRCIGFGTLISSDDVLTGIRFLTCDISKPEMITLLNTSVLTSYGSYIYEPLTLDETRGLISEGFQSAIGHPETAEVLSELLSTHVPVNRVEYVQQPGEKAIVFDLKSRIPAGVVLSRQEIEEIGYEFGLLTRTK